MLFLALASCDVYDESTDKGPVNTTSTEVEECDPVVHVASPGHSVDDTLTADADAATFGAAPEPFAVHLGWPGSDPSRSESFVWRTDVDTLATVLEYGKDGALDHRVAGASFRYGGLGGDPGDMRVHEVKLCGGLDPDTTYSYHVGGDGHWSSTYTFTTPGAPGTFDTFRVAMVGDSRGAYETWGQILTAIDGYDPDFILFSGDEVDASTNQDEWDAWFEAGGDVLARRPFVAAHGNHELLSVNYFAQFSYPNNELWYNVRYGDLQLVVLNDTVLDLSDIDTTEPAYMEPILANTDARYKVVMHHRPIYSTCTTHGSALDLRTAWSPVFDRTGVDLVLAGHNHNYERTVPIKADQQVSPGDGTVYVVSGGAGADLYLAADDDWFRDGPAQPVEHYIIGDFGPDGASFKVYDLAGNVIDQFAL